MAASRSTISTKLGASPFPALVEKLLEARMPAEVLTAAE
jgi:hypothetical protein